MMIMSSMRKCIGQIAATLVVGAACTGAVGQCSVAVTSQGERGSPSFSIAAIVHDLNADGRPDIASTLGTLYVELALAAPPVGRFSPQVAYSVGFDPIDVDAGDFDDDGIVDLVTVNNNSMDVSILFGVGDGTFVPELPRRVGLFPRAADIADFNGDGLDDVVVANSGDNSITILMSSLDQPRRLPIRMDLDAGFSPWNVEAADVNHDGSVDVVVANRGSRDVSLFWGNGDGTFSEENYYRTTFGANDVEVGDFNGDSVSDIIVAGSHIQVLSGSVIGDRVAFSMSSTISAVTSNDDTLLNSADMNGDGLVDILAAGSFAGEPSSILLNSGQGTFLSAVRVYNMFGWAAVMRATGDLNADGRSDIVTRAEVLFNTSFPITQQPQSTVACPIGPTTFSAAANGTPPYTYRWQYRAVETIPFDPAAWVDLVPGTNAVAGPTGPLEFNAAGTNSGTLTVDREALLGWPASSLIGSFRCIIGSACGDVITQEAVMTTSDRCSCYDFNSDENVDLLDAQQMAQVFVGLITPQADWLSGDLNADENADLSDAQALAVFVVTGTCGV
jgi:hypothetical protein